MTDDRLTKVRAEIERRKKLHEKSLINPIHKGFGLQKVIESKISELTYLLSFIDSMQKEPKECMYSKGNYTDEDRKALCDSCEEECEFNKKEESGLNWKDMSLQEKKNLVSELSKDIQKEEPASEQNLSNIERIGKNWKEPVSEDLKEEIGKYCSNPENFITYIDVGFKQSPIEKDDIPLIIKAIEFGANWQKQQLMAKAVDATVHIDAGGYPYIPQIELYDYDKDIPLAKEGDKYKVNFIKEI